MTAESGRLLGRGHPAGDFLEAWRWDLLEEGDGHVSVSAHLPDQVRNVRGELFGGYTPTYVDLISLFAVRSRAQRAQTPRVGGLVTISLSIDYIEPIVGPRFTIESRRESKRGRTNLILTRFRQADGLAALASTTILERG